MNQFNPMKLLQIKAAWEQFKIRHPKFPGFLASINRGAISEGAVIDVTITTPDGRTLSSNIKVTTEDMQLIEEMKDLFMNQ